MLERPKYLIRALGPSERSIHLAQFLQVLVIHKLR